MDGCATVAEVAAERRSPAEAMPPGGRGADRSPARAARPEGPPRRGGGRGGPGAPPPPPPPPDTAVVASPRHAAALERRARAREAALRAGHAAEVARLERALRDREEAHAAEVERLRAEHAAALRVLAEAGGRARGPGRTGAEHRTGPGKVGRLGIQARFLARPPGIADLLARITGAA